MRKLENSELNRLDVKGFKKATKSPLIIILDSVRSLNNIGSIFRSCDAFLVKKIYLCGITAKPPHKDIHKTALGSTESVDWEYRPDILNLIAELKSQNVKIISVEQTEHATQLNDFKPETETTYALIFGNEVKGVSQQAVNASHIVIEIPQFGTKHSLNIAVSVGVMVWDLYSKITTNY